MNSAELRVRGVIKKGKGRADALFGTRTSGSPSCGLARAVRLHMSSQVCSWRVK